MTITIAPPIVVVRRRIPAPAAELFEAWLNPEAMAQWMRPSKVHRTTATVDARVGGRYEIIMEMESRAIPHRGVYITIDPPKRLVFTWHSPYTGGRDTLVEVDFAASGDHTEVVVTHQQLPEDERTGHNEGWTSALEKLAQRYGKS